MKESPPPTQSLLLSCTNELYALYVTSLKLTHTKKPERI